MYHLCSPHSFCVVLFVWCTVVYAHGRTYIDVSFSGLYGVPLVYARGRTRIDRALVWVTIYVFHTLYVSSWMCPCSCLYGVPLVYARGRTYIDGALCDCMVYGMFVWCTVYVLSWSYSHRWLFIMFVCCTISVRTHRTYIAGLYCDCVVYRMSGWCTVYVLSCTHFDRSYHVCTVYR